MRYIMDDTENKPFGAEYSDNFSNNQDQDIKKEKYNKSLLDELSNKKNKEEETPEETNEEGDE